MTVEVDQNEAASGTVKAVTTAPGAAPVTVQIPPGVTDNAMFMLRGTGAPAYPGGPATDVVIQVRVRPSVPGMPFSAPPQSGSPAYGAPVPQSGPPAYGAPLPQSGPPAYGAPVPQSGVPAYDATSPQSGMPAYGVPAPQSGMPAYSAVPPVAPPAKGIPTWLKIVAPIVAVVILACCCFGAWRFFGGSDNDPLAGSSSSPTASPSPAVEPMSPTEYQALLSEVDTALAAGFTKLSAAKSPASIDTAATDLQQLVLAESAKLEQVTPPAEALTAHRDLLSGLRGLSTELRSTSSAADAKEVCRGPAATALVSQSSAVADLRTTTQTLTTVDPTQTYSFGTFLPKTTKLANRRLANGAMVKSISSRGPGHLKINNAGVDAVISLVPVGKTKPILKVYIRASKSTTVRGVPNGNYNIFWTSGKDWDNKAKAFTQNCAFAKFDDPIKYTSGGGTYTIWTISLKKSAGGNAPSSGVDPDSFPG